MHGRIQFTGRVIAFFKAAAGAINDYTEVITTEVIVTLPSTTREQKRGQHTSGRTEEANKQRQKAEANEVAGRHRNGGQMPHKGAR
jgi:hypothetical protein